MPAMHCMQVLLGAHSQSGDAAGAAAAHSSCCQHVGKEGTPHLWQLGSWAVGQERGRAPHLRAMPCHAMPCHAMLHNRAMPAATAPSPLASEAPSSDGSMTPVSHERSPARKCA